MTITPNFVCSVRGSVADFAEGMEQTLQLNDDKGGWDDFKISWLFERLKDEVEELHDALMDSDAEAEAECFDVANFAMMIADNIKRRQ